MINMYDFITGNASYFDQLTFGNGGDVFIDYLCPITDTRSQVWTHKNCLMYVMRGLKDYAVSDGHHTSKAGEVLFFRKGGYLLHQHFEEPYRALIFMFSDDAVRDLLIDYPDLLQVDPASEAGFLRESQIIPLEAPELTRSLFQSALQYVRLPTTESPVGLELMFRQVMVHLLRKKEHNHFYQYLAWIACEKDLPFMKLMRENSHLNFTVEELARTAHMSLATFKRLFKKQFGMSPGRWLRGRRMSRAQQLLQTPGNRIADVAFALGYSDVATFSKAFKRSVGQSPGDYRRSGMKIAGQPD